jgi:hypothetical protein
LDKREVDININININVQDYRVTSDANHQSANQVKIETDLSVSQLAYLFRLMYEVGMLKVYNQTDLLKFISGYFKTNNTQVISTRSLRSKYYNIDSTTRESVKKLLEALLAKLNQE